MIINASAGNLLWSSHGSDDWLGRPCMLDDGAKWIVIYRASISHSDGSGDFRIRMSDDEGATWSDVDKNLSGVAITGFPLISPNLENIADAIIMEAPNGDLLIHIVDRDIDRTKFNGTWQYRSTDGGDTWSSDGQIFANGILGAQDSDVYGSTIYISVMYDSDNNLVLPYQVRLYKSTDNGVTWTYVSTIVESGYNESGIIVLAENHIYMVLRDDDNVNTMWVESTDNGATWTSLSLLTGFAAFHRPRLRFDSIGNIMCVGRVYNTGKEFIVVALSNDRAKSWSGPHEIDKNTYDDCAYSDVLEKADGTFYLLTYRGTTDVAAMYEYEFSFTGLPSVSMCAP